MKLLILAVRFLSLLSHSIRLGLAFLVLSILLGATGPAYGQSYVDVHDFGLGNDGTLPSHEVTLDRLGNLYGTTLYGGPQVAGQVWKISASGEYQILHVFGGAYSATVTDGNDPKGGVAVDASGNLYGTTVGGGATGGGIVWEITTSGNYSILHSFGSGSDGLGPEAGVTIDRFGNLYGTTCFVGANSNGGMVWEITASGQYRDLHDFGAGADGAAPQAGVTVDATGNLFGTTYGGGANGWGMVWEINSSRKYSDLHDFGVGADGVRPIGGVTVDGSGNLYGTTYSSAQSESGPGTVWKITPSGNYLNLHTFGSSGDGIEPNAGVAMDSSGNLYGTATKGGANGAGVIWTLANGNYQVLHSFGAGTDGTNPLAGVTIDASNNLYGAAYDGGANGANCGMIWEIAGVSLGQLTVSPTTVKGGTSATGSISLSSPAPSGGVQIELGSSNSCASVPASVTVAAGMKSATFLITTTPVSTATTATITGTLGSSSRTATLTVEASLLTGVSLNPSTVVGGNTSTSTVNLGRPAPSGGAVVTLASSSTSASLPASVTVAEGATSATFLVSTTAVSSAVAAKISATADGTTVSATLQVTSATTATITLNPSTVVGGASSTGTVQLNKAAGSGGVFVALASGNSVATVPASVTVASGSSSATFVVSTAGVTSVTQATITATLNGTTQTATLTVSPISLVGLTLNPSTVNGGSSSVGIVTLNAPAGPNGAIVILSSSSLEAILPASITIPPLQVSSTFAITTFGVPVLKNRTITATLNGASLKSTLSITPPTLASVNLNPSVVAGPASSMGTILINGVAGPEGLIIGLRSSNPNAYMPSSIVISSGQSSASFLVTTTAVTSSTSGTITASLSGKTTSAMITVVPVAIATLAFSPDIVQGGTASTGTITLNGPAPIGGLSVKLSANVSHVSVPGLVTIEAGKASASFVAKTTAVSAQMTASVTAKLAAESLSATLTVMPPALKTIELTPSTVAGGSSSIGNIVLTSPAGTGGLVVKLTSSSASATVPLSVTVPAGQSSVTFKIATTKKAAETTASISATLGGTSKSAELTIK